MKVIDYRHCYMSSKTAEEETKDLFGDLLIEFSDAEPYSVEEALLFQKGDTYYLLEANGCSCWDGDYDGWEFTKEELIKWAESKSAKQEYEHRRQNFELLADWVLENVHSEASNE